MLIVWTFLYIVIIFICGYAIGINRGTSQILDLIAALLELAGILGFGILVVIPTYPAIWIIALAIQVLITVLTQAAGNWIGKTISDLQNAVPEAAKPTDTEAK